MERRPAGHGEEEVKRDLEVGLRELQERSVRDAEALTRQLDPDREMCLASFDAPAASPVVVAPKPQASLPLTASPTVTIQQYEMTVHCIATLLNLKILEDLELADVPKHPNYLKGRELANAKLEQQAKAVGKSPQQMEDDVSRMIDQQAEMADASFPIAVVKYTTDANQCLRDMGITP